MLYNITLGSLGTSSIKFFYENIFGWLCRELMKHVKGQKKQTKMRSIAGRFLQRVILSKSHTHSSLRS